VFISPPTLSLFLHHSIPVGNQKEVRHCVFLTPYFPPPPLSPHPSSKKRSKVKSQESKMKVKGKEKHMDGGKKEQTDRLKLAHWPLSEFHSFHRLAH
jgi:hypothetical protein